jgi:hypothetical protein
MKFITRSFSSFHSFYMLMFYILMNSSYKINLAKASITAAGIENNGKFSINQCTDETGTRFSFLKGEMLSRESERDTEIGIILDESRRKEKGC